MQALRISWSLSAAKTLSRGAAILYLFTTTVHTGVLGALITFARAPLYAPFDHGLLVAGALTPLEDQQLGGLIMWVPGALVYVGVALALLARWLRESETRHFTEDDHHVPTRP